MTTIAVDLRAMQVAADTQNTDSANTAYRCHKIEFLSDGRLFLGSGHLLSIGKARRWAEVKFAEASRPDFEEHFGERPDDFKFSVIVLDHYGVLTLLDEEMEPQAITDQYVAIGSGSQYAVGAMDAGADAATAVRIACERDLYTSGPVDVYTIRPFCKPRRHK